jgi:hypothetical protein
MRLKVLLVAIALCATGCKGCGSAPASADEVSPIPISTQPSVAIDARGRAVVGWYTGVVGGNNVAHARRLEKGTWTELGGLGDPREHNGPVLRQRPLHRERHDGGCRRRSGRTARGELG